MSQTTQVRVPVYNISTGRTGNSHHRQIAVNNGASRMWPPKLPPPPTPTITEPAASLCRFPALPNIGGTRRSYRGQAQCEETQNSRAPSCTRKSSVYWEMVTGDEFQLPIPHHTVPTSSEKNMMSSDIFSWQASSPVNKLTGQLLRWERSYPAS